ncbi:hypothetical protein EHS13_24675 [Paenibacillus psychroresistens]|uniref:GDYXXLXY domain-containing protein n=1 Tax=Paenibacillus psychroresistens TaxID=1778678 RepID=A0A6B8RR39_9BACL|nr:GDYXXLXY domain-containing protein [Paenibacillus psychroresistens]QGQ97856.1 hypothetical protein EHS13_24675 [Paenibacillus psychroresistens]
MIKPNSVKLRSKLIVALVLIQALFLIGIAISYYAIGWYGKEIRLQTLPIDPRDLLYGDYVNLNYDINELSTSLWRGPGDVNDLSNNLYVVLKLDELSKNGTYKAVALYGHKPKIQKDEVVLKGHTNYTGDSTIFVKYGLETYYVPENTGKELEQKANLGKLVANVKVASWGRAVIEDIEIP